VYVNCTTAAGPSRNDHRAEIIWRRITTSRCGPPKFTTMASTGT